MLIRLRLSISVNLVKISKMYVDLLSFTIGLNDSIKDSKVRNPLMFLISSILDMAFSLRLRYFRAGKLSGCISIVKI